jgi:hypothetical protein
MNGSIRGAIVAGAAIVVLASGCQAAPLAPAAAFLEETRAFCDEVGSYREAYEDWQATSEWDDWDAQATALVAARDEWDRRRPDELPADIETSIDRYYWSFVERLRGWDNVQALDDECHAIADSLERYVATSS